jgi:hypothetical protein
MTAETADRPNPDRALAAKTDTATDGTTMTPATASSHQESIPLPAM